jgi:putative ABC transport system permease protein
MAVYGVSDNKGSISDILTVGSTQFQCTSTLKEYPISMAEYALVDCYGFVVSDDSVFQEIYEMQKNAYQEYASEPSSELVLDFSDEDAVSDCYDNLFSCLREQIFQYLEQHNADDTGYSLRTDSKWDTIEYLYGMYGTLLFLGILLSLVFLFATALIIYYKQISEGYEDRNRFQIMQKVGMSTDEVKGTIRSQILLVFFLPLGVAALHVAFAFPILTRLLRVLFLSDQTLFLICTFATLGVFALIYVLIYRITARIYYQIVR